MMDTIFIDTGAGIKVPRLDAYNMSDKCSCQGVWRNNDREVAVMTFDDAAIKANLRYSC